VPDDLVQRPAVYVVTVTYQIAVPVAKTHYLAQLLERPLRCGVLRQVKVPQAPRSVLDHDKDVEELERGGDRDKEIARKNPLRLVSQKT
jgi:hypothetical protein